jgi:hypothetical protein
MAEPVCLVADALQREGFPRHSVALRIDALIGGCGLSNPLSAASGADLSFKQKPKSSCRPPAGHRPTSDGTSRPVTSSCPGSCRWRRGRRRDPAGGQEQPADSGDKAMARWGRSNCNRAARARAPAWMDDLGDRRPRRPFAASQGRQLFDGQGLPYRKRQVLPAVAHAAINRARAADAHNGGPSRRR